MPTSRSVAISVARCAGDVELDVVEHGLGAADGSDAGDGLECVQQFFTIGGDLHRKDFLVSRRILISSWLGAACEQASCETGFERLIDMFKFVSVFM